MKISELNRRTLLKGSAFALAGTMVPTNLFAQEKSVLRVHATKDLGPIDPSNRVDVNDQRIMFIVYNNLIRQKEGADWGWELDIAESIEQIDPTHVKFTLRPGIMWSGGFGELTAEDVKFSYERIANPDNNSAYKIDWELLESVEVVDKYTGVIVLSKPFAPLWTNSLPGASGCIVCKAAYEKAGTNETLNLPLATSGPYQIAEWLPNRRITLERNPLWSGEEYEFDEIQIIPITDSLAAEIAFEAGELDVSFVGISSIATLRENMPENSTLIVQPSLNYRWIGLNSEHPKLKDLRVRRAIQKAINVEECILAAYNGAAERSYGIVPPGMIGARDRNLIEYDPDAARALLKEAGVDGGLKLTMNILNQSANLTLAQVAQANLAEVGIELEIIPNESGAFWSLGSEADGEMWKDLQLYVQRFGIGADPSWGTAWFVCDQVGVWNWERVCNTEFDELHALALVEGDNDKRHEMYVRMQDLMEESGAYLFTTHGPNAFIHSNNVVPSHDPDGRFMYRLKDFGSA